MRIFVLMKHNDCQKYTHEIRNENDELDVTLTTTNEKRISHFQIQLKQTSYERNVRFERKQPLLIDPMSYRNFVHKLKPQQKTLPILTM